MTIEIEEQNQLTREVVQLDEIVSRAQELLDQYRQRNAECIEAEGRFWATLPVSIQPLQPGRAVVPHVLHLDDAERKLQVLEQKQKAKQEALRQFWEFVEPHRSRLLAEGFLK